MQSLSGNFVNGQNEAQESVSVDPVEVKIAGQLYAIRSDLSEIQVEQLAKYVDQIMQQIRERTPTIAPTRMAILAALNIAEELFRIRDNCAEVTERVSELINVIDRKCSHENVDD